MKIIRDGKEIDVLVITYFKLKEKMFSTSVEDVEYVMYTIPQDTKVRTIYLSRLTIENKLILPSKEELESLKKIIENFLSSRTDEIQLVKNKYEYIDINKLENIEIIEESKQKIELPTEKYIKLLSNKYLTYPKLKILNIEEIMKEGYEKNNKIAINICTKVLLIYSGIIALLHIILMINGLGQLSLFKLSGPTIVLWTLVISLISMTAFNFEEKSSIESWFIVFLIIFIFIISLSAIQGMVLIPPITLMSLVYSIIFTIPYALAKKISFKIVNKYKCRNYLTYFCVYLIPFASIFLILTKLYNSVFYEYINQILNKF
ncbi:MAG: hypothetical protein E7157_00570 [Lactobacillales bacterium]|nr:hypothetical protein [Lactobacillales bacterium]